MILLFGGLLPSLAIAQANTPLPLLPGSFRWLSPPDNPALRYAWVLGSGTESGPYILRVKLAAGGRIAPHTHPDERITTVLRGTIHVGFGEIFNEANVVAIPTGAVCVIPQNVPHYVWAKDVEAFYQEAGVGVTGTVFVNPPGGAR